MNRIFPAVIVFALAACSGPVEPDKDQSEGTQTYTDPIVLDASGFLDEIPDDHTVVTARQIGVERLFNNLGLSMNSRSNYLKQIEIPEPGVYHLFVSSHGQPGSTFRIAIDDRVIENDLGDDSLTFEKAGTFDLKQGPVDIRIMRIERSPVFDVLVLTKNENFSEADLQNLQLHPEVEVLKEYQIPRAHSVKFGDLTGDGKTDFMVVTREYSTHAFDHDGEELWRYTAPEEGADKRGQFEAPGLVWDLDGDGAAEALHWRMIEGREWLVASDGQSGEIKFRTPWPTKPMPHVYNNFRLAVGNLSGDEYPDDILVFTDMGDSINITAYDRELSLLWQVGKALKKDHLGHYVYPVDLDNDGADEVVVGSLVLDEDGSEIWNRLDLFYDHHDHADSYDFIDLTGNGKLDIVAACSDVGVIAYEGMTGRILWQNVAEHTQQIEAGDFIGRRDGLEIAAGARIYGNRRAGEPYLWAQVHWFDESGQLLGKWPGNPLNGNPVFVKGDWRGEGREELFWYRFHMGEDLRGKLYFGESVYHMLDFMGRGAEEVITLDNYILKVYGCRCVEPGQTRKRSPEYLKKRMANHSHYGNG